jgi:predicted ABC-type ATPase
MAILILSGPVGAGKTTVGRELLASAPDGTAYIEGDTFWRFLSKPLPAQPAHEGLTMTMRAMLAAAWRAEGKIANYDRYHEFYRGFAAEQRFVIDDEESTPAAIAGRIRAGMAEGTYIECRPR